jgi:probable addiction module antidote protein
MKKKITKKRIVDYQERLLAKLRDEEFAAGYLNEALKDEDPRMFLLALKNVIDAQKEKKTTLANQTTITRMSMYRVLSKKGNPKLTSIVSLLGTVGLQLAVQPVK